MNRPIRDRLKTAADLLTQAGNRLEEAEQHEEAAKHYDAATGVRAVLAPGGWTQLRTTRTSGSNLAIQMGQDLKNALEEAAAYFGESLSAMATEGLRAAAAGDFLPPRPYAGTGKRVNLNVRIPDDVLDELGKERLAELTAEAGYNVSKGNIAMSWIADELGVDRPVDTVSGALKMIAAKDFLEYVAVQRDERGLSLREVLEDGIRALLAGEYMPASFSRWVDVSARPRTAGGTWAADPSRGSRGPVEKSSLTVRIDADLLAALREWAVDMTEKTGGPFHAGMAGVAILKDKLGEPAEQ